MIAPLISLFASETVNPIQVAGNILDKLFTSDEEKLTLELARERLNLRAGEIQAEINKVEAAHRSIFVAGWRPFIGWVAGISLAYLYLIHPMITWWVAIHEPQVILPQFDFDYLFELIIALLGLSGLRTFEKIKGKAR